MNVRKNIRYAIAPIIFSIALFVLFTLFIKLNGNTGITMKPTTIRTVRIETGAINELCQLPTTITSASSGAPIMITFYVPNISGSSLYFTSTYSQLNIYADGHLIYQYGTSGSYPSYFTCPASTADSCLIPQSDGSDPIQITMEYFPKSRKDTIIRTPYVGSAKSIIQMLIKNYGAKYLISLIDMLFGAFLAFISVITSISQQHDKSLLWLGLFTSLAGTWCISGNILSIYSTGHTAMLYMVMYISFMLLPLPLILYTANMIGQKKSRIIYVLFALHSIFFAVALFLQLSGIMMFMKMVYLFHFLAVCTLIILTFMSIRFSFTSKEMYARLFCLPYIILLGSMILEVTNYYFKIFTQLSSAFLIGLNVFIFMCAFESLIYLISSISRSISQRELDRSLEVLRKQVFIEKKLYHQIGGSVTDSQYYSDLAHENNIRSDIRIDDIGSVPPAIIADISAICGDMVIIAIASCCRLPENKRYMKIHLIKNEHLISITSDYSLNINETNNAHNFSNSCYTNGTSSSINDLISSHDGIIRSSESNGLRSVSVLMKI